MKYIVRTNRKIEKSDFRGVVPAIQNGYMASPNLLYPTDYAAFEQTPEDRIRIIEAKAANKEARKLAYGVDYKKFLNIPSRTIGTIKA